MNIETATALMSFNGHSTDCICAACMMADLHNHIVMTRSAADADRLLVELGGIEAKVKGARTRFAKPGQACGTGVVRKISPKQAAYLAFLLKSRDFTSLMGKAWFTTDVENISLAGARTFIDALLSCPERPAAEVPVDVATPKQVSFIVSLLSGRDTDGTPYAGRTEADAKRLTKAQAKSVIENLLKLPVRMAKPITKSEAREIAGLYELDGEIYRMRKARGKSHFYAELLTDIESSAFEYASGMAHKVPATGRKLSLEECEALSLKLGGCCMCGRELTATVNGVGPGARFVGPICKRSMGL